MGSYEFVLWWCGDTHGFKSLPGFLCVLLRMTVHVSMVYDNTYRLFDYDESDEVETENEDEETEDN